MLSSGWSFLGAAVSFILQFLTFVVAQGGGDRASWRTLNGSQPFVVARGGFSGLFPDSSNMAYTFANTMGISGVIQWCDLQLTKDGIGLCLPNVDLGNCTSISASAIKPTNDTLDGVSTSGYFSYNYNYADLSELTVIQGTYSRSPDFDHSSYITTLDSLGGESLQGLWVNIQYNVLYKKHNLNMTRFLISRSNITINYLSSPEVAFLSNAAQIFRKRQIKFIFRFLEADMIEESTKRTYASLLRNLTFIKTFASGIIVPKNYIWPVTDNLYLEEHTSIVSVAHKVGLEIYAADFANDAIFAYNYSYNPISEYLHFIDNKANFSVDGVLTDYPTSASAAIGCFSHINSITRTGKPMVLSHNGASGVYPDCTDLAYKQAFDDGADFIDCPIQVTFDGVLICQSSINLMQTTTVTTSRFGALTSVIPQIQSGPGIFTFNLTWADIQSLNPQISNPYFNSYNLVRNPAYKNAGNFMTLSDFLEFAKRKSPTGITIIVENSAFLAENIGYDIIGSVMKALNDSGYNNNNTTMPKVMIQSTNSSVLIEFKQQTTYDCLYKVDELIGNADNSSVHAIRSFAHAVAVRKQSIFPDSQSFITRETQLVQSLKAKNLSVYVYLLRNEFVSQPWDFLSDPIVEIHNLAIAGVDGIITDFPGSGSLYKRRYCLDYKLPIVQPGALSSLVPTSEARPPALSPLPTLTDGDVADSPIPPLKENSIHTGSAETTGKSFLVLLVMLTIGSFLIIQ